MKASTPVSDNPLTTDHRPLTTILVVLALMAAGAVVGFSCGWSGTEHSVRFNGWKTEREFGRLPPLPFSASRAAAAESVGGEDADENSDERAWTAANALWDRAEEASGRGDFAAARKLFGDYVARTRSVACGAYGAPVDCQLRRNSAGDRLDALDSAASVEAVRPYLDARRAYDAWLGGRQASEENDRRGAAAHEGAAREGESGEPPTIEHVRAALERVPRERNLDDNVAYLRAALSFHAGESEEAMRAFVELAARHPRSEKREAALFTLATLRMKESKSWEGGEYATAEDACPDCRDSAWTAAHDIFRRCLREYPRGRFASDARGWLAYLHLRVGDTAEGLVEYYRMLTDERDEAAREEAVRSLGLSRGRATEDDMLRVEAELVDEPKAALAYAYHSLYNFAPHDFAYIEIAEDENPYRYCKQNNDTSYPHYCREFYEWEQRERERRASAAERRELSRVARFATRLMRGGAGAHAGGGGFALRLAQANLELGEDRAAHELARRALSLGVGGDERASAMWVKGVAEHRSEEFDAARRTFSSLVSEFPRGDLTEGARRFIAMAAEDAGDLEGALEQYLELDYADDVAYFTDVLLTPEQLAAFVEKRPNVRQRDELLYALGVRYLRAWRWDDARQTLARVRTTPASDFDTPVYNSWDEAKEAAVGPKARFLYDYGYDEDGNVLRDRAPLSLWLLHDLKTADDLERLQEEYTRASGDEARAEALYQLASYLYEGSQLMFYNPVAWRGLRERILVNYEESRHRATDEAQRLWRYSQEHETLARALSVYLDVVKRYPHTRAARDALFTAAACHERLSDFNNYWRQMYGLGLHAGARMVTFADVRRTYPDYRLPPGTFGWEPSTRTVHGAPAWPTQPRAKPLTGTERVRGKIKRAEMRLVKGWELYGEIYDGRVRRWTLSAMRWLVVALTALPVLLVFRRTRRARRFLYRQLTRRRTRASRRPRERYAPASSYAAHLPHTWQSRFCAARGGAAHRLLRLSLKERVRAALALNLFTHGLLTLLLWAVVWAARSG